MLSLKDENENRKKIQTPSFVFAEIPETKKKWKRKERKREQRQASELFASKIEFSSRSFFFLSLLFPLKRVQTFVLSSLLIASDVLLKLQTINRPTHTHTKEETKKKQSRK